MALIRHLLLGVAMKGWHQALLAVLMLASVGLAGCASDGPSTVLVNRFMMPEEDLPGDLQWVEDDQTPPGPQPMSANRLAQIRDNMNSNDPVEGIISTPLEGWSLFTAPSGDASRGGASQLVVRLASDDDARAYYDYTARKFFEQRIGCTSIMDAPSVFRLGGVVVEVYGTQGQAVLLAHAIKELQDFEEMRLPEDHVCPEQDPLLDYVVDHAVDTITINATHHDMRWDQTTIRADVEAGTLYYRLNDEVTHEVLEDLRVINSTKKEIEAGDVLLLCMEAPSGDDAENFTGDAEVAITFLAATPGRPPMREETIRTFEDIAAC